MGQPFRVLTNDKGKIAVYDRVDVDGEYEILELMGHSWWFNQFVNTICSKLYKNPMRVAWVGAYANMGYCEIYDKVWDETVDASCVEGEEVLLDGKILCNHTRKIYINCDEYKKKSITKGRWCLHPLPIPTCIGDEQGRGN